MLNPNAVCSVRASRCKHTVPLFINIDAYILRCTTPADPLHFNLLIRPHALISFFRY